ncbi:histidinol-phosphatase [Treponema sp.]|uniref:histidinol-phosphatase n=1 Tax=Treponema sp. TaxID=166 RepID=UPI00388FF7D7
MSGTYIKSNLHTHSTFCDGKNTIEENVLSAIKKGIKILGFTSHSMYPYYNETYMKPENFSSYCEEIRRLQKKYEQQITLRLAFEVDFIPGISLPGMENYAEFSPDYLIGSVHYIFNRSGNFGVDNTPEIWADGIKKYYSGNVRNAVCDYFTLQKEMLEKGDFALLGHPDLVRKFNEKFPLFDENESWYRTELKEMAKTVAKWGGATEINSGAISRNWLTKPYPGEYFLELLHEYKVPVAVTSDSHSAENLDCNFENSIEMAKKAGYSEIIYDIDKAGYKFCPL